MNRNSIFRTGLALAVAGLLQTAAFAQAPQPPAATDQTVVALTKPKVQSELSLSSFGIVLELPVVEGQPIKKGQLLLQQDARQEQAALEELELEANSSVRIDASAADLKVKEVQFARVKEMFAKRVATTSELEEAEMKVVYAAAQVKLAELEREKAKLQATRQRVKVDQMKLLSPIDGFIQAITTSVGQITDPQKPIMMVVQNDPMLVEFYLPVRQVAKLKLEQPMDVRYEDEPQWRPATVKYIAPVADTQSNTQRIQLELANPDNRNTGNQILVKLPAELVAPAGTPAGGAAALLPPAAP